MLVRVKRGVNANDQRLPIAKMRRTLVPRFGNEDGEDVIVGVLHDGQRRTLMSHASVKLRQTSTVFLRVISGKKNAHIQNKESETKERKEE